MERQVLHLPSKLKYFRARAFASMVSLNKTLMVIGGRFSEMTTLSSTEILTPDTDQWTPGPDLGPELRVEQSCVVSINSSSVIIVGGIKTISPIVRHESGFIVNVR